MKEWLEKFANENKIEVAKIYDGLTLFDKEIGEAKARLKSEFNTALAKEKAQSGALKATLDTLKSEFGLKGDDIKAELGAIMAEKSVAQDALLKGLRAELGSLKDEIAREKQAKNKAIRKNKLTKILDGLQNLNQDHREIVEIKLGNAFKIDESGKEYFERDGVAVTTENYLNDFFKANEIYVKAQGVGGNGVKGDFIKGFSDKKFSELDLTERVALYKLNPNEYERLKKESENG